MQTVEVVLNVPKETKEFIDLLSKVVDKVKAKAELQSYAELFDDLYKAVDGIDQVGEEMKSKNKDDAIAYLSKVIGGKL